MAHYMVFLVDEQRHLALEDIDIVDHRIVGITPGKLDREAGETCEQAYISLWETTMRVLTDYVSKRMALGFPYPKMHIVMYVDNERASSWPMLEEDFRRWQDEKRV